MHICFSNFTCLIFICVCRIPKKWVICVNISTLKLVFFASHYSLFRKTTISALWEWTLSTLCFNPLTKINGICATEHVTIRGSTTISDGFTTCGNLTGQHSTCTFINYQICNKLVITWNYFFAQCASAFMRLDPLRLKHWAVYHPQFGRHKFHAILPYCVINICVLAYLYTHCGIICACHLICICNSTHSREAEIILCLYEIIGKPISPKIR